MDVYTTEEQQVEAIKQWWRDNGKSVILAALVGLGGLYGWRYYQAEQQVKLEAAATAYTQVLTKLDQTPEEAKKAVTEFLATHQGGYTALAQLKLAKTYVDANQLDKAAQELAAVRQFDDAILNTVATLRLARIEMEMGNNTKALALLDEIKSKAWNAQIDELKGDIALKDNNPQKASEYYLASLSSASNPIVQMKLDNLSQ